MMDSTYQQIERKLSETQPGTVVFPELFVDCGPSGAIRSALLRLCRNDKLIRVAQGMYVIPQYDDSGLGLGPLLPGPDELAKAMAKRDKARIVPTGVYAQNVLGLSTQVPMNMVFLTDGSARKVVLRNGRGITFKHVAPKNLAFENELMMLVTFALKDIGQDGVEDWQKLKVQELLRNEPKDVAFRDLPMMPEWIRKIVKEAYDQVF